MLKIINLSQNKVILISMSFVLIISTLLSYLSPQASAETNNVNTDISNLTDEEIAEELTYIFNNAVFHDENGTPIIDENALIERYGHVPQEFEDLNNQISNLNQEPNIGVLNYSDRNECFRDQIAETYGNVFTTTTIAAFLEEPGMQRGLALARQAAQLTARANIFAIAAEIIYVYDIQCAGYSTIQP